MPGKKAKNRKVRIRSSIIIAATVFLLVLTVLFIPGLRKRIFYLTGFYPDTYVDPPKGYPIQGVDISSYQLWIDWETVKTQPVSFALIKASEGGTLKDPFFKRNWKECKNAGIKRGAYHFFRPNVNADKQVNNYLSAVYFEKGDFIPVLDIEIFEGKADRFYLEIDNWLRSVERLSGKKPIIYSYRWFYNKYLAKRYPHYPVWIASYRNDKPQFSNNWKIWQYTDRGKIKGIPGHVDHNVFNGSLKDLELLCF